MADGLNRGDVEVIKEWLRKIRDAYRFLDFDLPLSDGTDLSAVGGSQNRFQIHRCVEHIAHILQLNIDYMYVSTPHVTGIECVIEFEGNKYYEWCSLRKQEEYNGD